MPVVRHASIVARAQADIRLDAFLVDWLPAALDAAISRSAVRRLIMAGAVAVNGRLVRRPGLTLDVGWRVEARVDLSRLSAAAKVPWRAAGSRAQGPAAPPPVDVLYRDPWLIAVAKPAGLLVHASADPQRPDLFARLRLMLAGETRAAAGASGMPYLGLHQRLDVDTSGVLLFSLDPNANEPLSRAFAEHRVEKIYHALTARPAAAAPGRWTEDAPLAMTGSGRRARMSAVAAPGLTAETAFAILRRFRTALLVEARPKTGRKHQIRAHLAARGLAILGDLRYGGAPSVAGVSVARVMLHACALRLLHPLTGVALEIRCPYPRDFDDLLAHLS